MRHPILLWFLFTTVLVMGVVHIVSLELYLYWRFPWLDIPMHLLGGVAVALALLLLLQWIPRMPRRYLALFPIVMGVLVVGLVWEVFEIWAGIPLIEPGFERDMLLDICMDIVGGAVGYVVGTSVASIE
ncbi:MAG: hypothetical protein LR017_03925 [Candidatus Pacebacteria bacterium]|nr:hypothetical protein [Candidatus Paceibacterota bacterium]